MTLKDKIIQRIKSEGPISFEEFMDMCLYYPELGYYMRDSAKIGRTGDFYTSSHLHSIFGAMLGKQMEEMWELMGRPDVFNIIEMGAGMGYLAKDMLSYLNDSRFRIQDSGRGIFQHIRYTIIELNPSIKAKQQELLRDFPDKVNWLSGLSQLEPVKGCFISNELLDAFPVRLIEMDNELKEIYVGVKGDELAEIKRPCSAETREYFREYSIVLPKNYRTEINKRVENWLKSVSNSLLEGFVSTIDYGYPAWGYYSEERNSGTLLCYYQHQTNENPYQNIGEQDITAHVNFSSLKKWGEDAGLKTLGFCPQGTYLVSLGIDEAIRELYGDFPDSFETAKIKSLILPEGMGESHKVMIQYKGGGNPELRGFSLRNQVGIL